MNNEGFFYETQLSQCSLGSVHLATAIKFKQAGRGGYHFIHLGLVSRWCKPFDIFLGLLLSQLYAFIWYLSRIPLSIVNSISRQCHKN